MARGRTLDQKGLGDEPTWDSDSQPTDDIRSLVKIKAFSYYNYFNGYKDAKIIVRQYLAKLGRKDDAILIKQAPDQRFSKTIAWLIQMSVNGFELSEYELNAVNTNIKKLLALALQSKANKEEAEGNKPKTPSIQEIMKERAMEVGGDLEALLDEYIELGMPPTHKIKPIGLLMTTTVMPQHVPMLIEPWERQKQEYEELQTTEDKDLLEAYSNFGKLQVRNLIKFCELIIRDLHSYVTYKKSTRAKPKKKAVPIAKLVGKLKYLKKYDELKLESLSPTKIPESKEMFVYDTKKRKMHYYKADELSGGLTVKNSTIVGFSASESYIKTLRKPADQLKEFKSASKPNSRKFFKDIKAVETKTTGRFNENIVILKIFN